MPGNECVDNFYTVLYAFIIPNNLTILENYNCISFTEFYINVITFCVFLLPF